MEILNSDGQQFHQYQQNGQPAIISNTYTQEESRFWYILEQRKIVNALLSLCVNCLPTFMTFDQFNLTTNRKSA